MGASNLLDMCRRRSLRIATAESCTGGLVGALITDLPGSSDVFDRGFVTYSNEAKRDMLGVNAETLARFGAVSEEVAREMAWGALERSRANLVVAVTGIAGPGQSESKPEGRVCVGLAVEGKPIRLETHEFGPIGRKAVRTKSRDLAIRLLTEAAMSFRCRTRR